MRFVVLLFALFLVSCATPKSAPQAFYEGVYVPGNVEFLENGKFISRAGVLSNSEVEIARKAAFARLMLSAKKEGFRYFEITAEKTKDGLGKIFNLTGTVYISRGSRSGVYPLDAIKRLLKDLPLEESKPVYKPRSRKKNIARKTSKQAVRKINTVPAPKVTEEPLVIMAPQDITGSVKKAGNHATQVPMIYSTNTGLGFETENDLPASVSDLPKAVIIRRR